MTEDLIAGDLAVGLILDRNRQIGFEKCGLCVLHIVTENAGDIDQLNSGVAIVDLVVVAAQST